ncbi:HNH endonuclease signature motif containing protein [Novosphingobium sp. SG707]|uniref:HNH endonuclease n=1 Tax=Novosphingobium sp. SG707 TaxID=2586996 RepID=UPI00144602EC|nr:HNH endonuclease signature motif containing protein [Novosphingobium sp. SG707]NKI99600.1 5-methylcytosine-specific restriction endonuclease McrA [Novosphingobium sp. SG707]
MAGKRRLVSAPGRLVAAKPRLVSKPKVAEQIYQSPEWRALREARRKDADYHCVVCGSKHRLILDHIIEIRDGGPKFEPKNTQWLCRVHHGLKTEAAKRTRAGLVG